MSDNLRNVDGGVMVEVPNMFDVAENKFSYDAKAVKVVGT